LLAALKRNNLESYGDTGNIPLYLFEHKA